MCTYSFIFIYHTIKARQFYPVIFQNIFAIDESVSFFYGVPDIMKTCNLVMLCRPNLEIREKSFNIYNKVPI